MKTLTEDETDNLAMADTQDVTIFNISVRHVGGENVNSVENGGRSVGSLSGRHGSSERETEAKHLPRAIKSSDNSDQAGTRVRDLFGQARMSAAFPEGETPALQWKGQLEVKDLNRTDSSPLIVISGLTPSSGGRSREAPARGDFTQGEKYSDVPRSGEGALTHALLQKASQVPRAKEKRGARKTDGLLKSSIAPRSKPPKQSNGPMEQGGVAMVWESEKKELQEGRHDNDPAGGQWAAEGRRLGELMRGANRAAGAAWNKLGGLYDARDEHWRVGGRIEDYMCPPVCRQMKIEIPGASRNLLASTCGGSVQGGAAAS